MPLTSTVETVRYLPIPSQAIWPGVVANAALDDRPDFATMPSQPAKFPRSARLLRHADFERVYKQGRRHFSASMTVFYWARPEILAPDGGTAKASKGLRIGFTVGRALGGAVQRNRMKRRLREAVRLTRPIDGVAADVVINPKKTLLTVDFQAVLREVNRAFEVIEQKLSRPTAADASANAIAGQRKPRAESGL